MSVHGHFSERRNKNGSIGLKKVTDRLKQIDSGDEFDVLTEYVTTDKEQKKVAKQAKQMLDAAETKSSNGFRKSRSSTATRNSPPSIAICNFLSRRANSNQKRRQRRKPSTN